MAKSGPGGQVLPEDQRSSTGSKENPKLHVIRSRRAKCRGSNTPLNRWFGEFLHPSIGNTPPSNPLRCLPLPLPLPPPPSPPATQDLRTLGLSNIKTQAEIADIAKNADNQMKLGTLDIDSDDSAECLQPRVAGGVARGVAQTATRPVATPKSGKKAAKRAAGLLIATELRAASVGAASSSSTSRAGGRQAPGLGQDLEYELIGGARNDGRQNQTDGIDFLCMQWGEKRGVQIAGVAALVHALLAPLPCRDA